jgi:hypothetical protein
MNDYELQELMTRRQRAQGLRQTETPEGRMVGNIYVNANPLEYLAAGLRRKAGTAQDEAIGGEINKLRTKREGMDADAMAKFASALRGEPARDIQPLTPNDDDGNPMQVVRKEAVAPDAMAGYGALMGAHNPQLRQAGMQGMVTNQQEAAKRAQADALTTKYGQILSSGIAPQQAIAMGVPSEFVKSYMEAPNLGRAKVQFKDVGGQLIPVTEYGDTPQGVNAMPKTGNPFSDMLIRDASGNIVPNAPLVGAKSNVARAGATIVDARNFNTQESEQSKAYGKQLGEMRGSINQAGFDAPGKLARLDRMDQLLQGIDGGAAAPALADVASFAQSMGIKIDPKLGNKQAAEALAREMAGTLRQPGTGPMTDKDFENFLKQVPSLSKTAEGRAEITKTLRAAIQRDMTASKFARNYAAQNKGVIDDAFFDSMADFYAKNPVVTPKMPAANSRGQLFQNADAILNRK